MSERLPVLLYAGVLSVGSRHRPRSNAQTQLQVYGTVALLVRRLQLGGCAKHDDVRHARSLDHRSCNGSPSVELWLSSDFVNPLKLMNLTTDAGEPTAFQMA